MEPEVENYPGRTIQRDVDGKIRAAKLDPDVAREMGAQRWAKPRENTKNSLLMEAGYSEPEQAPEHLRVLADIAGSQRSGAVAALRDFRRLTQQDGPDVQAENPVRSFGDGSLVEIGGNLYWRVGADVAARLLAILAGKRIDREDEHGETMNSMAVTDI